MKKFISLLLLLLFVVGCKPEKEMYDHTDYSEYEYNEDEEQTETEEVLEEVEVQDGTETAKEFLEEEKEFIVDYADAIQKDLKTLANSEEYKELKKDLVNFLGKVKDEIQSR